MKIFKKNKQLLGMIFSRTRVYKIFRAHFHEYSSQTYFMPGSNKALNNSLYETGVEALN